MKRRNVMKTTMVVLMVYVMAFLTACGGGDVMPLPTSMAEEVVAETVEITETTDVQAETGETESDWETENAEETVVAETDIGTGTESVTDTVETDIGAYVEPEGETDKNEKTDAEKQSEIPKTAESVAVTPVQEEVKPVHTHNYTGNVTVNPSCEGTGVMTYVCGCGNSYNEPIVAAGHQWTTTTETVHHPSLGHMERTERKVTKFKCRCGYVTESNTDYQEHCSAAIRACNSEEELRNCPCAGPDLYWTEIIYEDNWVVTQEEFDEVVTKTVCAVCGAVQ